MLIGEGGAADGLNDVWLTFESLREQTILLEEFQTRLDLTTIALAVCFGGDATAIKATDQCGDVNRLVDDRAEFENGFGKDRE